MAARSTRTRKGATRTATAGGSSVVPAAIGAALFGAGALALGWWLRNSQGGIFGTPLPQGHEVPDLALDTPDTHGRDAQRAPDHFRPDATSPIPAGERDNFAPAYARPEARLN